jgi:hypothetical protein
MGVEKSTHFSLINKLFADQVDGWNVDDVHE